MSNAEHLIENALGCLESGRDITWFKDMFVNKEMFKYVNATAEEIWDMAIYVYYTYRPCIESDLTEELEKKYGYKVE